MFSILTRRLSSSSKRIFPNLKTLSNEEIIKMVQAKEVPHYRLEDLLEDPLRAIEIRRKALLNSKSECIGSIPVNNWDSTSFFTRVQGRNCENVIGFTPIPLGVVGPLTVNGESHYVPLATTEGALIASTNRGITALTRCGGVIARVTSDAMTRAPILKCKNLDQTLEIKHYIDSEEGYKDICNSFETTTSHGKVKEIKSWIIGNRIHIRIEAETGEAMGMNMLTKGSEKAMKHICSLYEGVTLDTLSGNMCTDKKTSAVNWVMGRGKSVSCEATLTEDVVRDVLKCTVQDIVRLNTEKNLVGSAMAGSIGGNNAHAANIIAGIFIATGQDAAQVVESSNCLVWLEEVDRNLHIMTYMPSIEVGTIGGGTSLEVQKNTLQLISSKHPVNSVMLAQIIAGSVMAGELSLIAAQASGDLVKAHEKLGRKSIG
ncbi:hypothetical protein WA158_000594 [Blastocystis sp. Blastoise]